jgi:hypothetical protein
MKTTIALIAFLTITQSPARDYERHDYYSDTHRQDVDRIIEAQAATTKAVEAARVQAEDDAQRARSRAGFAELEAKLEAAH